MKRATRIETIGWYLGLASMLSAAVLRDWLGAVLAVLGAVACILVSVLRELR